MNIHQAIEIYAAGTSEGAIKGWLYRARGFNTPENPFRIIDQPNFQERDAIVEEAKKWNFDASEKGELGWKMRNYVVDAFSAHIDIPRITLFSKHVKGELAAIGYLREYPVHGGETEINVDGLVVNPKFYNTDVIKGVVVGINDIAKQKGFTKVNYSRSGKGALSGPSKGRTQNIQSMIQAYCNPDTAKEHGGKCGRHATGKKQPDKKGKQKSTGEEEKVLSDRAMLAKENYVPITKEKYQIGMKFQKQFADAIGGKVIGDNAPFDVIKGNTAFEVKTIQNSKKDRIEMRPDSKAKKEAEAKKGKLKTFTVGFDIRQGKEAIYIREGVGAYRFGSMKKLKSLKDLVSLVK